MCWTVNIIRNALILDWNFISVILQTDMALFTGNTINSLPIADCTQAVLTTLDKEMRKSRKRSTVQSVMEIGQYLILTCDLRKQKNGDKFIRLYDKGDFSEYGSQSEADAALCALIAFRTGSRPGCD